MLFYSIEPYEIAVFISQNCLNTSISNAHFPHVYIPMTIFILFLSWVPPFCSYTPKFIPPIINTSFPYLGIAFHWVLKFLKERFTSCVSMSTPPAPASVFSVWLPSLLLTWSCISQRLFLFFVFIDLPAAWKHPLYETLIFQGSHDRTLLSPSLLGPTALFPIPDSKYSSSSICCAWISSSVFSTPLGTSHTSTHSSTDRTDELRIYISSRNMCSRLPASIGPRSDPSPFSANHLLLLLFPPHMFLLVYLRSISTVLSPLTVSFGIVPLLRPLPAPHTPMSLETVTGQLDFIIFAFRIVTSTAPTLNTPSMHIYWVRRN